MNHNERRQLERAICKAQAERDTLTRRVQQVDEQIEEMQCRLKPPPSPVQFSAFDPTPIKPESDD